MDGLWWKTLLKWMIWGYHYFRKHPVGYNQSCQIFHAPVSTKMLLVIHAGAPEYNQVNKKNHLAFLFFICFSMWKISRNKQSPAIVTQKCTIVQSIWRAGLVPSLLDKHAPHWHQQQPGQSYLFKRNSNPTHSWRRYRVPDATKHLELKLFLWGNSKKFSGFPVFLQTTKNSRKQFEH